MTMDCWASRAMLSTAFRWPTTEQMMWNTRGAFTCSKVPYLPTASHASHEEILKSFALTNPLNYMWIASVAQW